MESLSFDALKKFEKHDQEPPVVERCNLVRSPKYSITDDPYLKRVQFTLNVEIWNHIIPSIPVDTLDCVEDVKRKIEDRGGIQSNLQRLVFAGILLKDCHLLANFNIQDQTTLHLVMRLRGGDSNIIQFEVIMPNGGKRIALAGISSETIESIKTRITACEGIPEYKQRLFSGGLFGSRLRKRQMEDHRTLSDYKIQNGTKIYLVCHGFHDWSSKYERRFLVKIICQSGYEMLCMKKSETIGILKSALSDIILHPSEEIVLLYEGNILLDDNKELGECGIVKECHLIAILTSNGGDCLRFMQTVSSTRTRDVEYLKSSLDFLKKRAKIEEFIRIAKGIIQNTKQKHRNLTNLSEPELLAIVLWTSNILYQELNESLRLKDDFSSWNVYLKHLIKGLKHMPYYRGKAYRGFLEKKTLNVYKKGEIINWKTVSAFSKKKEVAMNKFSNKNGMIFEVDVFSSRDISLISRFSAEEEVLVLPYSRFEVIDVIEIPEKAVYIKLKEIPTPRASKIVFWINKSLENNLNIAKKIEDNDISYLSCTSAKDVLQAISVFQWVLLLKNTDFKIVSEMGRSEDDGEVNNVAEELFQAYDYDFKILVFGKDVKKLKNWNGVDSRISQAGSEIEVQQFLDLKDKNLKKAWHLFCARRKHTNEVNDQNLAIPSLIQIVRSFLNRKSQNFLSLFCSRRKFD